MTVQDVQTYLIAALLVVGLIQTWRDDLKANVRGVGDFVLAVVLILLRMEG